MTTQGDNRGAASRNLRCRTRGWTIDTGVTAQGEGMAPHRTLEEWVDQVAATTRPERIHWCDGSELESQGLIEGMLRDGTLVSLNQLSYPGCYLHRSHPSDVARTEHLTFICAASREEAGPTNNWMAPQEARERV